MPTRTVREPRTSTMRWRRIDGIALAVVTLTGGLLRLVNVWQPSTFVFDEIYYAQDACWYVHASAALCGITEETSRMHPPLGKWLIAVGIRIFGYTPFGWRIASVVAGTVTIALLYLLARRLLHSTAGALIASGLLAIDYLHFVHSRLAMLDVFVTLFGVAAVLFCVYDRDRGRDRSSTSLLLHRPWRLATGAAAGAAVASKWSGASVLLAVLLLTVTWEVLTRRPEDRGRALMRTLREEGLTLFVAFGLLPLLLYAAAYVGRLPGDLLAWPWSKPSWIRSLAGRQHFMLRHHSGFLGTHPDQSPPWSWLLLKRPIVYFVETTGSRYREILAFGSPLVWWASIPTLLYSAVRMFRRRSPAGPELVILVGFVLTYGPWLILGNARTFVFLFYLLPSVPFMCLALAYAATHLGRSWHTPALVAAFAAGAIALFVFHYPILSAVPLSYAAWKARVGIFERR